MLWNFELHLELEEKTSESQIQAWFVSKNIELDLGLTTNKGAKE